MKNKLFISSFESSTEYGFLAKSMCDVFLKNNDTVIRCLPDFTALNQTDPYLSNMVLEKSETLDTIIQFVSSNYIEYHFDYKNIVVVDPQHFFKRNMSILDKLFLADEVWVFDNQQKEFLGPKLQDKVKVVGYPYSKKRVSNLFENKKQTTKDIFSFYTFTDIYNIENIKALVYNFIVVFQALSSVDLTIYIKNHNDNIEIIEQAIKETMEEIEKSYRFIDSSKIKSLIKIVSGNPYVDTDQYVDYHINGDCYLNIDYNLKPDVFTASYLKKYILSIVQNIGGVVDINPNNIIETVAANYREFYGETYYYNELNSYPKINDISIQDKLINIFNMMKNKTDSSECYSSFNENNFFNDKNS
jgi:hypothetical protein